MKNTIKVGFGLYIGWTIAEALDKVLGKVLMNGIKKKPAKEDNGN